ncbi:glucosaminidase domain-containing protein [Bariatricus sp. SGI.161]|uniref:glucosaminidase domain-containing protein n=1 Tax=Bariatricus sp. SGI.161 TaxID=3420550 RepID=UPI003CFF1D8E
MSAKRKIRCSLILCFMLFVVGVFGNVSYADEPEENYTEIESVKVSSEEESNSKNTDVEETEVSDSSNEISKEEIALQKENIRIDSVITTMDAEGNITEVESESGYLEDNVSAYTRIATPQIVNFNTRGNAVTEYTEYGTVNSGYINGMFGADAAYLGTENGKVKFMISGVIGLVDSSLVQVVNISSAQSISYYIVSNGRLYHYITTNITKNDYATVLDNGPAPNYLNVGEQYYSYDGHYFYTQDNFGSMLDDYNQGSRNYAVNSTDPYYNYFQYLPMRSKTKYSAEQIDQIINGKVTNSKMTNTGSIFENCQNQYGVNVILACAVAANESAWGKSSIAMNNNNLFGLNAIDSSPGDSANTYSSVESCIKTFSETYMSKQYLNPENWVYSGGFLGNKGSGINVRYASDPYWGEKNANIAWMIDRTYDNQDVYVYSIGIKDLIGIEHTNLNVRNEPNTTSKVIHTTKNYSNQSFIILDDTLRGFYKIQSDAVLNSDRTNILNSGNYNYNDMYAYVSSDYVKKVIGKSSGNVSINVPEELKNVIEYRAHVQEIGWQDSVNNGQVIGTIGENLSIEAIELKVKDINSLGIEYRAHVQDIGWQDIVSDGATSGTVGQAKKMEAIQIRLTGESSAEYDIYYRTYVSEFGWLDWAKNGELAGTQNYNYALQAMQIVMLKKGSTAPGNTLIPYKINTQKIEYCAHVQDIGWQQKVENGEVAGTTGQNKKIEAFTVNSVLNNDLGIKYRAFVQDIGWMDYEENGEVSGTVGQNKRMEALQIELTGNDNNKYDIYYRVHVQDKGWLGWARNGQTAGTINYDLKIEAMQIILLPKGTPELKNDVKEFLQNPTVVRYCTHVEDIGWQKYVKDGQMAGTTGKNKQIEAFKVQLFGQEYSGDIQYSALVENVGWQEFVSNNSVAGTVGKNKQIEAVKIQLTGEMSTKYDVYYRVHASEFGWLGWTKNGLPAGNKGYGKQIEAIQIQLVNKNESAPGTTDNSFLEKEAGIIYSAHVQDIGWQDYVSDGAIAGTTGKNKQIEAIKIQLDNLNMSGDVKYKAHVQDVGWQDYVFGGKIAGTVGKNKQVEAICIELTGKVSENYNVYYRVHASEFGWLGWAKNGEKAGSEGYARQVEAIQIKLVKKEESFSCGNIPSFFKK